MLSININAAPLLTTISHWFNALWPIAGPVTGIILGFVLLRWVQDLASGAFIGNERPKSQPKLILGAPKKKGQSVKERIYQSSIAVSGDDRRRQRSFF